MKKLLVLLLLSLPVAAMAQLSNVTKDTTQILTFAEEMPEYPGGVEALYRFLAQNIVYPPNMRLEKKEAKVYATFIIDSNGRIRNIEILNKVPAEFAEETIRVIKMMPAWKPGSQDGKNVTVKYSLPVRFQLN